jgi:hypothetical protein
MAACVAGLIATGIGAPNAQGYIVRAHGHVYGILPAPNSGHWLQAATAAGQNVSYLGGPVMLSNRLYLIFWGPAGSFAPSYEAPIIQWAEGLAADSGRTTNEFSVASLYYRRHPHVHISRSVTFGGVINDARRYPQNGCVNPAHKGGVCLSDAELEIEVARDIRAHHWPTDRKSRPQDQYLVFTPSGVDSCQDRTETSCTFASKNAYCAYHSAFLAASRAIVYSNLPYQPACDSGQAPTGVLGNADTDGTLDSAIHEVLESATDPQSTGFYDPAWVTHGGSEVGDECDAPPQSGPVGVYGAPLGGSTGAESAFNQIINTRTYYTQMIWALGTSSRPGQGCVQRIGPTPQFKLPKVAQAGQPLSFDATGSYDLARTITRYAWDYGDGTPIDTSQGVHAVHTYAQPGAYTVSLTVSDASGPGNASTQTKTVEVH